jgi:hypothetical protein
MYFRPAIYLGYGAVVIPETCQQYLGVVLKILVKKTLIKISLSGTLDLNGNWLVGQIW